MKTECCGENVYTVENGCSHGEHPLDDFQEVIVPGLSPVRFWPSLTPAVHHPTELPGPQPKGGLSHSSLTAA